QVQGPEQEVIGPISSPRPRNGERGERTPTCSVEKVNSRVVVGRARLLPSREAAARPEPRPPDHRRQNGGFHRATPNSLLRQFRRLAVVDTQPVLGNGHNKRGVRGGVGGGLGSLSRHPALDRPRPFLVLPGKQVLLGRGNIILRCFPILLVLLE